MGEPPEMTPEILKTMTIIRYAGTYQNRCVCFSKIFSQTTWQMKVNFHVECPWEGGTKIYMNVLGHMEWMTALPIYGKTC